jgi:prolyl-tRNA synthetase
MYWSQYFIPTLKETPVGTEAVSHQLLLRSGCVNMLTSGVYSYLPLGLRVLRKIENIIREEMDAAGAQELFLPVLQPIELWKTTGRDDVLKDVMIRFQDKRGREICLGPTHEEVITELVKNYVQSYRQLPITLYQIQTKFRDELRTRFGIVRACEFVMKDAYSFDRDSEGMKKNYQLMYEAYQRVFRRCDLKIIILQADSGAMGGDVSHEFLVEAPIGEDFIQTCGNCGYAEGLKDENSQGKQCPRCQKGNLEKHVAIELGHVFQLGTKYSQAQGALFLDEKGKQQPIIMGCYGIGVSRLIAAVVETHYDKAGIIWPREITPFDVEILPLQLDDENMMATARQYYETLSKEGFSVLLDDRDESAGKKFNDADLIGIPCRVILGKKAFAENKVEVKDRKSGATILIKREDLISQMKSRLAERNP